MVLLLFFFLIFIYLFWLHQVLVAARGIFIAAHRLLVAACMWDLVPRPGMEPRPPALGAQSLTHWTTREDPVVLLDSRMIGTIIKVYYFILSTFMDVRSFPSLKKGSI